MSAHDPSNILLCIPRPSHTTPSPNSHHPHPTQRKSTSILLKTPPPPPNIPPNHITIKIEKFGFSANNVTYGVLGDHPHFRYFDFHPLPTTTLSSPSSSNSNDPAPVPPPVSRTTHGLIPVWGFGTIIHSTHPRIAPGERVYGYHAMCRYLTLEIDAEDVNRYAFYVKRNELPPDRRPYNQLIRCSTDLQYNPSPQIEDLTMLYRPLFWTSYWCEDWLWSQQSQPQFNSAEGSSSGGDTGGGARYRGATTLLISSASAKTAFCLAWLAAKRMRSQRQPGPHGSQHQLTTRTKIKDPESGDTDTDANANASLNLHRIIGLTSARNLSFTKSLGIYTDVYSYDEFFTHPLATPAKGERWLYVDVASNEVLNSRILNCFGGSEAGGAKLVGVIGLGLTNVTPNSNPTPGNALSTSNSIWGSPSPLLKESASTSTPAYEPFFMPTWLSTRRTQLSAQTIIARQQVAWDELMRSCPRWVRITRTNGAEKVRDAYERIVDVNGGGVGAEEGLVWSMWDADAERAKL